jgi:hypothetical protein
MRFASFLFFFGLENKVFPQLANKEGKRKRGRDPCTPEEPDGEDVC